MTDPVPRPAPDQAQNPPVQPTDPTPDAGIEPQIVHEESELENVHTPTEPMPGEPVPPALSAPLTEVMNNPAVQPAGPAPSSEQVSELPPDVQPASVNPVTPTPTQTDRPTAGGQPRPQRLLTPSPNQPATNNRPATTSTTAIPPLPADRKAPEWKVLEPTDRNDPVEHEIHTHVQRPGSDWQILAASVRGKLHAHQGNWRDDAFAHGWVDDWTITVVSDGAGGSPLSRVGARLACDESVNSLREILAEWKVPVVRGEVPARADLIRLRVFMCEAARRAQRRILQEARHRNIRPNDLNATLLLAVHTTWADRDLVSVLQVGDGVVGLLLPGDVCKVLGVADHGEYSAQTRFLTTPGIEFEFDQRVLFACQKDLRCLALMTDGVADDFFPEQQKLIDLFLGNPIADMKTRGGDPVRGLLHDVLPAPRDGRALADWLRYEKRQSSDDRTLLVLSRSPRP